MTIRRIHAGILTAVTTAALLGCVGMTSADKRVEPEKSISLSDLQNRPVIGALDYPLGTIVTIEGVVADGSYTKLKADDGKTLLRVQMVNGKELASESVFHFDSLLYRFQAPQVGTRFKFAGYESGGFTGIPNKAFDYVGLLQSTSYYFSTWFVILRDETKARD
jgi:hypothetical protein